MSSRGFIELLRLNERGKQRKLGQNAQVKNTWSGVAFEVGGARLVAPLGEVSEVISPAHMTMVPKSQSWLKGLINLRGRLLPVTDLTQFLGLDSSSTQVSLRKVVVVDHADVYGGLLVDRVFGIMRFSEDSFNPAAKSVHSKLDPYLQGSFKQADTWHVFLLSRLIEDERYLLAAV